MLSRLSGDHSPAAGARRRAPRARLRLLRARRSAPTASAWRWPTGRRRWFAPTSTTSLSLCTFTCAAVPCSTPSTGRLEGCVNLTTWSAVVERPAARAGALGGEQHRRPDAGPIQRPAVPARPRAARCSASRSRASSRAPAACTTFREPWNDAVGLAERAMAEGSVVAAVGEPGSGRSTLLAQAARHTYPRDRILSASAPDASDVQTWLGLWAPEFGKAHTAVIVRDVDLLPALGRRPASRSRRAFAASDVAGAVRRHRRTFRGRSPRRWQGWSTPSSSAAAARPARRRAAAGRPRRPAGQGPRRRLQPRRVARPAELRLARQRRRTRTGRPHAASRTDIIDVGGLPPEVLAGPSRHLSRIEAFERGEIVRVLTSTEGPTMAEARDNSA